MTVFRELASGAAELSGIDFANAEVWVRERTDKLGRPTFQGKVGYKGPLAVPGWPRILFDLIQHDAIVSEAISRPVLHPYPDELPEGRFVLTYSLEELLAEKTRTLWERTRPRDAYDVLFLLQNDIAGVDLDRARDLFARKCRGKGFGPPTSAALVDRVRADEK